MKELISITPLSEDRVVLIMNLGTQKAKHINIRKKMLPAFIRNQIISRIERYVNNRLIVMRDYGGYTTQRKLDAASRLKRKLQTSNSWTILATAKHIRAMREDLVTIMPGLSSKNYNTYRELLADLVYWADKTINEHNQTYTYGNGNTH